MQPLPGPGLMQALWLARLLPHRRVAFTQQVARHGRVAALRLGPVRLVVVTDAELAHQVLTDGERFADKGLGLRDLRRLLDDGLLTAATPQWQQDRPALARLFDREETESLLQAADQALRARLDGLRADAPVPTDLAAVLDDVLQATLLQRQGCSGDAPRGRVRADLARVLAWVERQMAAPWPPLARLRWWASPAVRAACRRLHRLPAGAGAGAGAGEGATCPLHARLVQLLGAGSTPAQVHAHALTMLWAGSDTTSAAAQWTLDCLSRQPDAAERVAREARAALPARGTVCMAQVAALPVTRSAVKEALRLHPPVWALPRYASRDAELGGHLIPQGSEVLVNVLGIHRDPRYWPDPLSFRIDRFAHEPPARGCYLPFSVRPRSCIGMHVGTALATLLVARVLQRHALRPALPSQALAGGMTRRPDAGSLCIARR